MTNDCSNCKAHAYCKDREVIANLIRLGASPTCRDYEPDETTRESVEELKQRFAAAFDRQADVVRGETAEEKTEYIERRALIENVKRVYCTDCNSYNGVRCRACGTGDALDMIEDAPAADVVEVVRCKDCKSYNDHRYCYYHADPVMDDDFCSYGERRKQTDG